MIRFLLFFLIILPNFLSSTQIFYLEDQDSEINKKAELLIEKSIKLDSYKISSDIDCKKEQLEYLIGFDNKKNINSKDLSNALNYVFLLKRFSEIKIDVEKINNDKIKLNIFFKGAWNFKRVKIEGIPFGKDEFVQKYLLEPGDVFNEFKHKESIEKILESLKNDGYFQSSIIDSISKNEDRRLIDVKISINRRVRFSIEKSLLYFKKNSSISKDELNDIYKVSFKELCDGLKKKKYSKFLVQEKIKKIEDMLKFNGFLQSKIEITESLSIIKKSINLTFNIDLGKKRVFDFFGNRFFSEMKLNELLYKFKDATNFLPGEILKQELINEYKKHGYLNVDIDLKESKNDFFVINEGNRSYISKVAFLGIEKFPLDILYRKYAKKIIKKHSYDQNLIDDAIDGVLRHLKINGYLESSVSKKDYIKISDNIYELQITFFEGNPSFIDSVKIDGFDFSNKSPFKKLKYKKNFPFSLSFVQELRVFIIKELKKMGFLTCKVSPEIKNEDGKFSIYFKVDKGTQIFFGKTIFKGTTSISKNRLIKELRYKDDDMWDYDHLQKSLDRLRSFGVFQSLSLSTFDSFEFNNKKDVIINVDDDDPYEIRMRLGFQQVAKNFALKQGSTYKAGSTFLWKNPLNYGDQVRTDFDFSRFDRSMIFTYKIPWFFKIPLTTEFQTYARQYIQPIAQGSKDPLYKATQKGALIALSGIKTIFSGGINLGFEFVGINNVSDKLANAINFSTDLVSKEIPYFIAEPNVFVDYLDDKLNPSKGFFTIASVKSMIPFHSASYLLKFLIDHAMFFPFFESCVLATKLRLGHIFRNDFKSVMPTERFYLGGSNSLRGYEADSCPPIGSFMSGDDNKQQWVAQGGKSVIGVNFEIRVPFLERFQAVAFQDFGALTDSAKEILYTKNILAATGFGLRLNTPVGPLRFDLGFKWKKRFETDRSYAWFLTFGQAF